MCNDIKSENEFSLVFLSDFALLLIANTDARLFYIFVLNDFSLANYLVHTVQNKIRASSLNLTAFFSHGLFLAGCQQE